MIRHPDSERQAGVQFIRDPAINGLLYVRGPARDKPLSATVWLYNSERRALVNVASRQGR
jgi:hypothetical protein